MKLAAKMKFDSVAAFFFGAFFFFFFFNFSLFGIFFKAYLA